MKQRKIENRDGNTTPLNSNNILYYKYQLTELSYKSMATSYTKITHVSILSYKWTKLYITIQDKLSFGKGRYDITSIFK